MRIECVKFCKWYRRRLHSALGYLSPQQFEDQANEILRKATVYFAQAELDRRFKP